ncbi:MAG: lipopolysaccharide transport periplasmic protein LptA [Desulfuromonadales bacterium]|nr:lipopolysaccharide transport periplasmic protein LptA [Desulfuromonadales bacterium]MDW7756292.1 lipopolysaccharide transport periplasmic protein LptA [Desulfuromonadales bacterium]
MKIWVALFMLLTCLLAIPCGIFAEENAAESLGGRDEPIHVVSDQLEADQAGKEVRFIGNVVARQGEVVMYAQEMRLVYDSETREVEKVVATGDVRIVQGDRVATGQQGTLFNAEKKMVLTGNPKLFQGENSVSGDEITVYLEEERSTVSSAGGSRVQAIFHPKEESP